MNRLVRSEEGFSILELMVSLSILLIIMIGVMGSVVAGTRCNAEIGIMASYSVVGIGNNVWIDAKIGE